MVDDKGLNYNYFAYLQEPNSLKSPGKQPILIKNWIMYP